MANTLPLWVESKQECLAELGITAEADSLHHALHDWRVLSGLGVTDHNVFAERLYAALGTRLGRVEFNEGATELLHWLRSEQKKLAIVTSTERRNVLPVLERLGLSNLFDTIIDRTDVLHHKPHAEPIETALKRLGAEKSEAVMIGDSVVDVEAGHNAQVKTVWFNPTFNHPFHHHLGPARAHVTVASMVQLHGLLRDGN